MTLECFILYLAIAVGEKKLTQTGFGHKSTVNIQIFLIGIIFLHQNAKYMI